jgi:hypothetical protein
LPPTTTISTSHVEDLAARRVHRVLDEGDELVAQVGDVFALHLVEERLVLEQHALHRGRRVGRGDLAGRVSTHAVADHEEAERRIEEQRVLVVVALLADVGLSFRDDVHVRALGGDSASRLRPGSNTLRPF